MILKMMKVQPGGHSHILLVRVSINILDGEAGVGNREEKRSIDIINWHFDVQEFLPCMQVHV